MRIPSDKKAVLTLKSKGNQGSVGRKYEGTGYLPLHLQEILNIGMAVLKVEKDQQENVLNIKSLGSSNGPVREGLEAANNFFQKFDPSLMTFGSSVMPTFIRQCLFHGVSCKTILRTGSRYESPPHRFFDRYHTDISKTITNNDPSEQVPLNEVAEECGLPGRMAVDDSQVDVMYTERRLREIRSACEIDVALTTGILLKVEHLQGNLTGNGFLLSARTFLDFLEEQSKQRPHFREFLNNTDFKKFLNASPSLEEGEASHSVRSKGNENQDKPSVKLRLVEDI